MIPMNETARKDLGDYALRPFGLSQSSLSQAKPAAAIAWDEAAACLAKCDFAGFDAAMRIFRNVSRDGSEPNKPLPSDQ